MEEEGEWGSSEPAVPELIPARPPVTGHHIKKRSLRNKALSVGFNDKDLMDFVTGFHKRKKKRRKIAQKQMEEKERLRRIEARKRRKLEKELALYGGALPSTDSQDAGVEPDEDAGDLEEDELDKTPSVSGTRMYENGDMTITVTTSKLSREDEDLKATHSIPGPSSVDFKRNQNLPVKKKPLKRVAKGSHKKHQKRGLQKGKKSRNKR